jgi:hypothetical protein
MQAALAHTARAAKHARECFLLASAMELLHVMVYVEYTCSRMPCRWGRVRQYVVTIIIITTWPYPLAKVDSRVLSQVQRSALYVHSEHRGMRPLNICCIKFASGLLLVAMLLLMHHTGAWLPLGE